MALTIPVAHDFICPWCWVGHIQAKRLEQEFDVKFEWLAYELIPRELEWSSYPAASAPPNKPKTPSRFDFILFADGLELPNSKRPHQMRTFNAHEAVEYAKTEGVANELIAAFYEAYWLRGENINELETILNIAKGIVNDLSELEDAVRNERFRDRIVPFDDEAYSKGVYNVPTFFIGGERLAEQPYSVVHQAVKREIESSRVYQRLSFPPPPADRPYSFINMVTTIDGKILTGDRNEDVLDLGAEADHSLMKRIVDSADALIIGAQTLRASPSSWIPKTATKIVVSRSGNIPFSSGFFSGGRNFVATTEDAEFSCPPGIDMIRSGTGTVDLRGLLAHLRAEMGINHLLVMGGSEFNAQLLSADLIDELFITIAPKIKLGRDVPTYADGEALSRENLQRYGLIEHHAIGDEIFIRYRRIQA